VRRPPGAWRLAAAAAVAACVAVAGCSLPGFGAPDPKSEQGETVYSLWQGFFLTALAVAGLVWGLLIFVILRYRRRRADDPDAVPSQRAYNVPLEILYSAVPVMIVAVLFGVSWAAQYEVTDVDPEPAVRIDVVGFRWSWQFVYPDEDVAVSGEPGRGPEMVIPRGQPVQLRLLSSDVNHSFWVPDFLSKRDLIPGVDNTIDVTPTEVGTYAGRCAEFCGLDHWRMNFSVRVVEEQDYEAWLDEQRASGDGLEPSEDSPELGEDSGEAGG
jgi:cytochrome c oxidase subunit II